MPQLSDKQQAILEKMLGGRHPDKLNPSRISRRKIRSPVLVSFAQQRLWVLARLLPGNPFYNIAYAYRLHLDLDVGLFHSSLGEVVRRHESLRTIFSVVNEEPVQVILPELAVKEVLQIINLKHLGEKERQNELHQLAVAEASKPFDLEKGPLLRLVLVHLATNDYALFITMHHIISDGWSFEVFIRELGLIYRMFLQGAPSPLAELPIQYADFSLWQRQMLQGQVLEKQLSFWRALLVGELPMLALPVDRQRPAVPSYQGDICDFLIPAPVSQGLAAFSRSQGCTLFMTLLAALNVLLYRYTNQSDILVGTPIANRNHKDLESLIGFFSNTLVFRTNLTGNPSFSRVLGRVQAVVSGAYDNQDLPFEKLVQECQPHRFMSHTPFFQVMLNFQNIPGTGGVTSALNISELSVHNRTSKFDLRISISGDVNQQQGKIEYNIDIFNHSTIERMCGHWVVLLEGITRNPDQPINDLPILTNEEKEQLLVQWTNTDQPYAYKCLHHIFEEQVDKRPDHTALISKNPKFEIAQRSNPKHSKGTRGLAPLSGLISITYRQLNQKSNQLAHLLRNKGVQSDTLVGIMIERSIEMVIGLLGILKAGGAYMPIDPDQPEDRIAYMLKDSGVKTLLTRQEISSFSGVMAVNNSPKDTSSHQHLSHRYAPVTSLAYVIYTSGSTGRPKGVMTAHKGICNRLQWMQEECVLTVDDRVLQKTPFGFDVSVWEFFWPLSEGAVLVLAEPGAHKDSVYIKRLINRERITTLHFVPSMLNVFLEEPGLSQLVSLKQVICSGEVLPLEYQERFFQRLKAQLYNFYGPTEASVDVTYWACALQTGLSHVPIGVPAANTHIYILDRHFNPVPVGVPGELHIGGVQLACGYLNQPELTAEKFIEQVADAGNRCRWGTTFYKKLLRGVQGGGFLEKSPPGRQRQKIYKTGDLVRWLPDGSIEFLGRLDFQVKVRGFRIELGEIEANLRKHPYLEDAVVLAVESMHGEGDKKLTAYIILNRYYWRLHQEKSGIGLLEERVSEWQAVFDDMYMSPPSQKDPVFNIAGWNSSYSGEPLPAIEMRQWLDNTVERILALKPKNVMEIGCGTGLLLFRIIPFCRRYTGTDIAEQGLNYIHEQLAGLKQEEPAAQDWAEVKLIHRSAEKFDSVNKNELDLVVLNSVVQYFPSVDYLVKVLKGAVDKVRPGGYIFIGDVRSLPLLKAFHASVEFYKAEAHEPDTTREQLNQKVMTGMIRENELVIDPDFFYALLELLPKIKGVRVLLKHGQYRNELTRFRYDVILHVHLQEYPCREIEVPMLDWEKHNLTFAAVCRRLKDETFKVFKITGVPNWRTADDIQTLKWLNDGYEIKTVGEFRKVLAELQERGTAPVDPEDFWELSSEYPYEVEITLSDTDAGASCYDVFFKHWDLSGDAAINVVSNNKVKPRPWCSYTNNPLLTKLTDQLVPELKSALKEKLPEYMVPGYFVPMEALPLTSNGKLNRQALPDPTVWVQESEQDIIEPGTEMEKYFALLWSQVLQVNRVGINQNFFQLGGDSIKAIQVVSRANKQGLQLSVQHLYRNQTVAELARETARMKSTKTKACPQEHFYLSSSWPIIARQLPKGVEIRDIYPVTPLQRHMIAYYHQQPIPDPGLYIFQRTALPLHMNLDISLLEQALKKLTAHFPILRTALVWQDLEEPVQVICQQGEVPLFYRDLSHLSPDQQQQRFRQLLAKEWQRGFSLTKPQSFRLGLVKLADDIYKIFFTGCYIRIDGWSSGIIQGGIIQYYLAMQSGEGITLPPTDYYKNYLHHLRSQDLTAVKEFWCSQFKGYRPGKQGSLINRLQGNQPENVHPGVYERQHIYFSLETTLQIKAFLQKHQLVQSCLASAVWGLLLSAYANQSDVVFGFLTSGRTLAAANIEVMMGHTINILPVRVKINPRDSISDWLRQIFYSQAESNRYDYTPIEKIYQWCGISPQSQLFESFIVVQNLPQNLPVSNSISSTHSSSDSQPGSLSSYRKDHEMFLAKMEYPLRLDIYARQFFCLVFNYNPGRINGLTIKGFLQNLQKLYEGVTSGAHRTVGELLPLISI